MFREEAVRHHVISVDLQRVIHRVLARGEVAHLVRARARAVGLGLGSGSGLGLGVGVRLRLRLRLSCPRVGLG